MIKVKLLAHTPQPQHIVAIAARMCYAKGSLKNIEKHISTEKEELLIKKLLRSNHHSPLEHASFTFYISNISRACMCQITRHRIASFSVRSQRYVSENNFAYAVPENFSAEQKRIYENAVLTSKKAYNLLKHSGALNEDARGVLPNCCSTQLITTFNARSLLNFFDLRLSSKAQDEIRSVARKMLQLCYDKAPVIFSDFAKHIK